MAPEITPLPPGIGPHEGREAELMAAGRKPFAMFCDIAGPSGYFPEDAFEPLLAAGQVIRREYHHVGSDGWITRCLYYALPGEEWRIEAAEAINREVFTKLRTSTEEDDIRLGQLLGYSEDEIKAYLVHSRSRRST